MNLHSKYSAKIAWHISNKIKYVFLKASNIVLFPAQIWKAFLPSLEVLVPINLKGEKLIIWLLYFRDESLVTLVTLYKLLRLGKNQQPLCVYEDWRAQQFLFSLKARELRAGSACTSQEITGPTQPTSCRGQGATACWAQRGTCSSALRQHLRKRWAESHPIQMQKGFQP